MAGITTEVSGALRTLIDPGRSFREKSLTEVNPDEIIRTVRKGTAGDESITNTAEAYTELVKKYLMGKAISKLNRFVA